MTDMKETFESHIAQHDEFVLVTLVLPQQHARGDGMMKADESPNVYDHAVDYRGPFVTLVLTTAVFRSRVIF